MGVYTALAQTTEYQYDALNRRRFVIQPPPRSGDPSPTTETTYYATGELNTLEDPNGNLTTWNIDDLGRVREQVDPLGNLKFFEYDASGNLTQQVDRLGRVTQFDYDALDRLTDETWFINLNSLGSPVRTISYRYDLSGNLTSADDPSAGYLFLPDGLGRLKTTMITLQGVDQVTLVSQFDKNSNRTELATDIGGTVDFVNRYDYDALDRLVDLQQDAGSPGAGNEVAYKQVGFDYNLAGQVGQVNRFDQFVVDSTDPTGALVASSYDYDPAGRLATLSHTPAGVATFFQAWNYDALNRVTASVNTRDQPVTHSYAYDDNNQVIHEVSDPNITYDYDLGGNRTDVNGVTSTSGAANRLQSDGTYDYTYDDEGNVTRRVHQTTGEILDLFWDHRNRLVQLNSWLPGAPEGSFELYYAYDAFNRRVARHERMFVDGGEGLPQLDGWVEEKYIYDGDDVVFDFQSVDGAGHELLRRYLHGPAVDQIFAQENVAKDLADPDRVYWLLTDNLGTVRDIANHAGVLIEHFRYDSFGRILEGDTSLTRYLYTSREFDASTGLQYNRNRWYDSYIGAWLSEDPDGFRGGDTNLYRYVGNGPTNGTDPSGLAGNPLVDGTCIQCVPRYRNHQIVGGMGGTNAAGQPLSGGLPILAAIASIFVEPFDWALTGYEIYNDPWSGWSYAGLLPFVPAAAGKTGRAVAGGIYDVGRASDLRKASPKGTSVHHVPQSRQAESLIGDFNVRNSVGNEPSIRLLNSEHEAVTAAQRLRTAPASARNLLADDIRLLRQHTNAPNSALKGLIQRSRGLHRYDYEPLHRVRK